jgi:uncharacterized protein YqeY
MSETLARLQSEMKECMKSGNKERLSVVRMLLNEVKNAQVNQPGGRDRLWSEAEIVALVASYHKNLVKTVAEFPVDRQEPLKKEIAIVEDFLPRQMTLDEVKSFIKQELAQTTERNFGLLMKAMQPKLAGRADGKSISEALKASLSELG